MKIQAEKRKATENKNNIMKEESKIVEVSDDVAKSIINDEKIVNKTNIENIDLLPQATTSKKDEKTIITNPSNKPEIKPTNIRPHIEQQKLNINEKFTSMNTWNGAMTDKYGWSQTNSEVSISIKLPEGKTKANQLQVDMKRK